ncbi:hypothetical protein HED55_09105 [Ochrobactrum haematophilum]|uniref:Uncharacterized protein n=1 Tax=Brucella haematophila TaxID=419474 RepID=A0ABX1DKG8_9HYPH|nr:hypothetical protein [Brucella haematophila]
MNNSFSDFYGDYYEFYDYFQEEAPRPEMQSAYNFFFPAGAVYSSALNEYIAPPKNGCFFEEDFGVRNKRFHDDWGLGIHLDRNIIGRSSRINIFIRNAEIPEKSKYIRNVVVKNPRVEIKISAFSKIVRALKTKRTSLR